MTNSNGAAAARPDAHVDAAATSPAMPSDSLQATPGAPPIAANESQPAADATDVLSAVAGAMGAAADGPEGKEKNKIFETVRLKARLSMAEQELEKLRSDLSALRDAPAEYQDKNMRLLADMENLRRRTERERADTAKFAITRFARDVLTVADNFQRAIDTVPKDEAAVDGPLKTLFEGVELTGRELLNVLERNGVKKIDPTGMRFDPNVHQAMMQVDNPEVPNGTVMQAFQPAYMIEDRVLRPAMVVVSRGGPKMTKAADGEVADAGSGDSATSDGTASAQSSTDGTGQSTPGGEAKS
jgi:molecular chaperone GrpE